MRRFVQFFSVGFLSVCIFMYLNARSWWDSKRDHSAPETVDDVANELDCGTYEIFEIAYKQYYGRQGFDWTRVIDKDFKSYLQGRDPPLYVTDYIRRFGEK